MTLETFFEKFDLFADAPDAVAKMRKLVLQLAVRGKLVDQNPRDADADSLLESIASAQKKNGRRKTTETADPVELPESERWHDVPSSWRWVRLGTIGDIVGGGTPRSENSDYFADEGIPWLTPADLNGFKDKRILRGRRCVTKLGLENSSAQLLPEGSVLFSSRAPIGYVAIAGTELATNQGFKSCVPFIKETNEFLYYYLMSAAARIDSEASGTTFREVSGKIVNQIPVPLPPLAEQKRIVAKVDELMALCDRLEAQQEERETRHAALARASLARFADAPTPANLDFLFHQSYGISPADLRKSILTLAVQGKLVPQNPNDEQAAELSEPDEELAAQSSFEIPNGWTWNRLSQLADINGGFAFKSTDYTEEGTRVVRISDFDEFGFKDHKVVRHPFTHDLQRFCLAQSNILMAMTGGTVGKSYLVKALPEPMVVNQRVATLKILEDANPNYIDIVIRSEMTQEVIRKAKNSTNDNISMGDIKGFAVPLPSLAEQRRIVAKVDGLMALVDALETQLATAGTTATTFLATAVAELTAST